MSSIKWGIIGPGNIAHNFADGLKESFSGQLVAIASKSIKEVTYHLRHSSKWVIRLGDGTSESNKKSKFICSFN